MYLQYPVFPCMLSDYVSEGLDLSNQSNYRDLSKVVLLVVWLYDFGAFK